jgi:hypothetical protein
MANPEHVAKLKEGVEAWREWRHGNYEHSLVTPDFTGADLSDAPLSGAALGGANFIEANLGSANLMGAVLRRANLIGANLSHARLTGADLLEARLGNANLFSADLCCADIRGANLHRADLLNANLRGANLTGASLIEADLRGANLVEANLSYATLCGADMTGVQLAFTMLGDTDVARAKGLDWCLHSGPSIIDYQTLANAGPLPLAFLRGCGVPDVLIDYLPSLLNQPIQFHSCFISYSTGDQEFAERLHADLQNNGVRCWFAPEDLKIGDHYRKRIDEAIHLHDRLLLILSENSVRSGWVRDEVESGLERENREKRTMLFPVRLDEALMNTGEAWAASIRRQRHVGDFRGWKDYDVYSKAFRRLLRDLKPDHEEVNRALSNESWPD